MHLWEAALMNNWIEERMEYKIINGIECYKEIDQETGIINWIPVYMINLMENSEEIREILNG